MKTGAASINLEECEATRFHFRFKDGTEFIVANVVRVGGNENGSAVKDDQGVTYIFNDDTVKFIEISLEKDAYTLYKGPHVP
jgi:hypothetical protein